MRFEDVLSESPRLEVASRFPDGTVRDGSLAYPNRTIPVRDGIPRFVDGGNYADNFGIQWTNYQRTQFDSQTGLPLTAQRFWQSTRWRPEEVRGSLVLEVGSGAGRFTEILLGAGARVVSCDLSKAVDANFANNRGKGDLLVFQASVYDLPFPDGAFDNVFCYGVLQHLPDPDAAYRAMFRKLKPGGRISVDYYEKLDHPSPWSTPKYYWHPLTRTLPPEALLQAIRLYVPRLLPLDTAIRTSGPLGQLVAACLRIPCWNYHFLPLSDEQKTEWAVMDTFDALGARYDVPKTLEEVRTLASLPEAIEVQVFHGSNGVVANARRRLEGQAAAQHSMTLDETFALAVKLHREGRLGEAAELYSTVLSQRPDTVPALYNLGVLFLQRDLAEQAAELLDRAASLSPSTPGLQDTRARARERIAAKAKQN